MITREKANYLHTLILQEVDASGLEKILPHFNKLHVLTLVMANIKDCPTLFGKLIHLRYRDMSKNRINSLSSSICKLYNLQTLNIMRNEINQLPEELKQLTNLRHLLFDPGDIFEIPPNLGKLTSLQTLPTFIVSDKKGCGIDELGYLKNLGGELTIRGLELVTSKVEAESANLVRKTRIENLRFHWGNARSDLESNRNDELVLEGLQPHPNIKEISIVGFRGKKFPQWTIKMAIHEERQLRILDNLIEVKLSRCDKCEEIPALGHLPHLKHLTLEHLSNVRSIGPSFYGSINDSSSNSNSSCIYSGQSMKVFFPALKTLTVRRLPNLVEWVEVQVAETQRCGLQIFPCLEELTVKYCPMWTTAPSHFPCLKKLSISDVASELPLRNITRNLTSLIDLSIERMQNLTCLLDELLCRNQTIKRLELYYCPNFDISQYLQGYSLS